MKAEPIVTLVLIVIIAVGSMAFNVMIGGDPIGTFSHEVTGKVTELPTNRYIRSEHGGQEKYAITLTDVDAPDLKLNRFGSKDKLLLECKSTRCGQLKPSNEIVRFGCSIDGRLFEEDILYCTLK